MTEPKITETTEDRAEISRWQKYGKDRLYINKLGKSWDNVYIDLTGEEGHSTAAGMTIEETETGFKVERETGWDGNKTVHETIIETEPEENDTKSEVPPEVPYNARTAGKAQQINAQE